MMLLVSTCYSDVEFADDDSGDYSEEHGFIEEGRQARVVDVIRELREEWSCGELSACPVTAAWCPAWVSRFDHDTPAGSRQESYHLKHADGRELSSRELFRIYRAAGLAKGKA